MINWLDSLLGVTTSGKRGQSQERLTEIQTSAADRIAPVAAKTISRAADIGETDEGLGEPVDYSKRLQEFDRTMGPTRRPNEGERNGDLVWRQGKWHTAPMVSEKTVDRRAVMEKFAHPEHSIGEDLALGRGPSSPPPELPPQHPPPPLPAPGTDDGPSGAQSSDDGPMADTGAAQPSRDDLVQEAVSVLKKLCTAPRYTAQIRKELKKQKVIK